MPDRAHLSIGEVLSLVQEEFPDITISKIRFLESQGLLDPERTPSGYRKFYESDIERLQWILTQQRDHFLPLKIIRDRLAEWDATGLRPSGEHQSPPAEQLPGAPQPDEPDTEHPTEHDPDDETEELGEAPAGRHLRTEAAEPVAGPGEEPEPPAAAEAEMDARPEAAGPVAEPDDTRHAAASLAAASAMEVRPSAPQPRPAPPARPAPAPAPEPEPVVVPDDGSLTADELAARAGVPVRVIHELEGFSMITSRRIGPDTYYGVEHLPVVEACRVFLDHGVEVRHLRMYKIAAEREAGVLEQLIMPLLKQRHPEARARAVDTVAELARVGEELHAALLRQALRNTLPS